MEGEPSNGKENLEDAHNEESSKPVKKTPMTDEERAELAGKLDADLEDFMSRLEKQRYTEGWPEDRWQEEMEKHPFFMTKLPGEGEEMSPLIQGLQQLKYDETENTPTELAVAYKDDGNFNFKCKNYRFAILGYTEGLRKKCGDPDVEAQLYNNRAAAHYFLANWRSCVEDCKAALKRKPDYPKAQMRLAHSLFKIRKWDECMSCLDEILQRDDGSKEAKKLRGEALICRKAADRDIRKGAAVQSKQDKEDERLMNAFTKRRIKLVGSKKRNPNPLQAYVHFVDDRLVWPVVFLYPEYSISDVVQAFHEDTTFTDHLKVMFEEPPSWDRQCKYQPDKLNVYYENTDLGIINPVRLDHTLGQALALRAYVVNDRTPCFLVAVKGSKAEETLLRRYK